MSLFTIDPYRFGVSTPTVLSVDDFNRADNTTIGDDQQGNTWKEDFGAWSISSNQLRAVNPVNGNFSHCHLDLGEADVDIQVDVTSVYNVDANGVGIVFRYIGLNDNWRFLLFRLSGSWAWYLQKRVSGAVTTVDTGAHTGGTGTLRVVADGSNIDCYIDGVLKTSQTGQTDHQTVTKHGVNVFSTPASNAWRFDDWSVYAPGTRP